MNPLLLLPILKGLPWKLIGWAALALAFISMLAALRLEQAQNGKLKAQLHECTALRIADRQAYAKAQTDAATNNKAQSQRIEQQYKEGSDATKDAYARDHAELVRLRQQRDSAAKGAAGAAGSPKDRPAAAGTDAHGVQVPAPTDVQTTDAAADIELRLMHLQNYVAKLLAIDPNKP